VQTSGVHDTHEEHELGHADGRGSVKKNRDAVGTITTRARKHACARAPIIDGLGRALQ